jgi:hypothetical protein
MNSRRAFAVFLALMVVVVHLHCICGHDFSALLGADQPKAPQHCENESACLCKGATLAHAVVWDAKPPSLDSFVLDPAERLTVDWRCAAQSAPFEPRFIPTKPSGRILRAYLSSLVL